MRERESVPCYSHSVMVEGLRNWVQWHASLAGVTCKFRQSWKSTHFFLILKICNSTACYKSGKYVFIHGNWNAQGLSRLLIGDVSCAAFYSSLLSVNKQFPQASLMLLMLGSIILLGFGVVVFFFKKYFFFFFFSFFFCFGDCIRCLDGSTCFLKKPPCFQCK